MRRVDLRCPWGRSAEDVVSRKRGVKAQELHRTRLAAVRGVVDTSAPSCVGLRHLKSRGGAGLPPRRPFRGTSFLGARRGEGRPD